MTERDGSTIDVDLVVIEAELAHAGNGLNCEGFVQFDDVHIVEVDTGPDHGLAGDTHGSDAHDFGRATTHCNALDARKTLELIALGVLLAANEDRGRAIRKRRRSAGGNAAISEKSGL